MHLTTTLWLLWIQPTLRQAAVATLRHLSERDPVSLVVEQIEEDLFAMLDNETDERWSATLLTLYASLGLALHFR
jgi:hypothetical protein